MLLQVFSIISKSDISIKPYILGKFLQGVFASIYTYFALKYIPIFNLDLVETSSSSSSMQVKSNPYWFIVFWFVLSFIIFKYKKKCLN